MHKPIKARSYRTVVIIDFSKSEIEIMLAKRLREIESDRTLDGAERIRAILRANEQFQQ